MKKVILSLMFFAVVCTGCSEKREDIVNISVDNVETHGQANYKDEVNDVSNDLENEKYDDDMPAERRKYLERLDNMQKELEISLKDKYESGITMEMLDAASIEYSSWSGMLNEIYTYLCDNLDEEYKDILEQEQRWWFDYRESASKEAASEFEDGSFASINEISTLKDLTKDRCYELVIYNIN